MNKAKPSVKFDLATCLLGMAIVVLGIKSAPAGEWMQSASTSAGLEHDTNFTLSAANPQPVSRRIFAPIYIVKAQDGAMDLEANFGLRVERSSKPTVSANRDDPNLQLSWHQATETGGYGIKYRYESASILATELAESGQVVADGTRKTQAISAGWTNALGALDSISANAEVKAAKSDTPTATNFGNLSAGLEYKRALTENLDATLNANASRYMSDRAATASATNTSMQAGLKYKSSENLDWHVHAGINAVGNQRSWRGSLAVHGSRDRNDFNLSLGRSISASGVAGFVQTSNLAAGWRYEYDEMTQIGVDGSSRSTKGPLPNTISQVGAWVGREVSQAWNVRLTYVYKQRTQSGLPTATADFLGLTLAFRHFEF